MNAYEVQIKEEQLRKAILHKTNSKKQPMKIKWAKECLSIAKELIPIWEIYEDIEY